MGKSFGFGRMLGWVTLFPRLYHILCTYNVSIAAMAVSHGALISWNFNFFTYLNDQETTELASLSFALNDFSLPSNVLIRGCSPYTIRDFFLVNIIPVKSLMIKICLLFSFIV